LFEQSKDFGFKDQIQMASVSLISKKTIKDYFVCYRFNETFLTVLGIVEMRRNPKLIRKFEE
jgi:hypothetical protein